MNTPDPRAGKPSASGFYAMSLCPAKFRAEQDCGLPEKPREWTEDGNKIHEWLKLRAEHEIGIYRGVLPVLSPANLDVAEAIWATAEETVTKRLECLLKDAEIVSIEERLWDHESRFSGVPDLLAVEGTFGVILDFKSGWLDVPSPEVNLQLRALAVLADQKWPGRSWACTTISRYGVAKPPVVYEGEDLKASEFDLGLIMQHALQPNAVFRPSLEACRYCRARPTCKAALATLDKTNGVQSQHMTPEELSYYLGVAQVAERVIADIREQAKSFMGAGGKIPGWTLKPGTFRETITDLLTVHDRLVKLGVTEQDFVSAVSLTKKNTEAAIRSATGLKGKALASTIENTLQGCTESKQSAPSIVKEGE